MPELVGDQVKDAAQLKATSPLEQAARITQPLLMAYGGADERVPLYHGKQVPTTRSGAPTRTSNGSSIRRRRPRLALPKNRIDFWSRVEKFLDKHIGKP